MNCYNFKFLVYIDQPLGVIEVGVKEIKIGIKTNLTETSFYAMGKGQELKLLSLKIGWDHLGKRG